MLLAHKWLSLSAHVSLHFPFSHKEAINEALCLELFEIMILSENNYLKTKSHFTKNCRQWVNCGYSRKSKFFQQYELWGAI